VTTDGHLDAVVLAEYDDGLLDQTAATDVREHLAQCPTCSATLNGLGDVRDRLAEAPAEIAMPAAVAARIDGAIAAERVQARREPVPAPTATIHPFRRRLPQLLAAAATVAAVAFGGYVVATTGGGDSADTTSAEGAAADSGDGNDSGPVAGSLGDEAAGREEAAAPEPPLPAPAERTALTEQIRAVAAADLSAQGGDSRASPLFAADCGLMLARELDTELIGVASTDIGQPGAVLVVVETGEAGVARGFVLPACGSGVAEALRELTVPIE
jgi:anti-sigma factor RsiW